MRSDSKNLFSQFLEGLPFRQKPVFQFPEPRLITLDNHPENVIPFTASNIKEACLKADIILRRDGVQGASWVRGEPPQAEDTFATVRKLRERAGNIGYLHESSMREMNGLNLMMAVEESGDEKICVLERFRSIPVQDIIRPELVEGCISLSYLFDRCSLSSRFQLRQIFEPHFDGSDRFPYIEPQEDALFMGRPMRVIVPRNLVSTLVYNTHGDIPRYKHDMSGNIFEEDYPKLKEAWRIGFGDYLFSCNLGWGENKALVHSPEAFSVENEMQCREVDVFNLSGGIPLEQIEI